MDGLGQGNCIPIADAQGIQPSLSMFVCSGQCLLSTCGGCPQPPTSAVPAPMSLDLAPGHIYSQ